ncbi:MAG: hypothetical protein JWN22_2411 [Nocardioides sp.]|nr:hypothetical protein [Nocardioides sp.]
MESCASCGHALGVGRFCTNCGHPVGTPAPDDDWRTDTVERPAVDPGGPARSAHRQQREPRRWLPWITGFAALAVVAVLGVLLLTGGDDADQQATDPATTGATGPKPTPTPSPTASDGPSPSPSETAGIPVPGKPQDVARLATATVPATAPPNEDVSGNLVRYEARNLLDGVPETCWRMPGDGTGDELTFELDSPTRLTEVGLVNGYAKTATDGSGRPLDWYHGNRRVLGVEWVFDDGTTIPQTLDDTRALQSLEIDPVTTSTVLLRLVSVSAPGTGRAARNYTPVSDVALVGTAA